MYLWRSNGYNTAIMKKSLAHLPELKQDELELIAFKIRSLCEDVQMVILFGSYARGDWKNPVNPMGIKLAV